MVLLYQLRFTKNNLEIVYQPEIIKELQNRLCGSEINLYTPLQMIRNHNRLFNQNIYTDDLSKVFGKSKAEFLLFIKELNDLCKLTQETIHKVKKDIKDPNLRSKQDLCQKTLNSLRQISRDLQKLRQEIKPISKELWDIKYITESLDHDFYTKFIK